MAKINVQLEAFYGYDCYESEYGSNRELEFEISDKQIEALRKIGKKKISHKRLLKAINNGEISLQPLYNTIEKEFFDMVEHYWLFEADNECLAESIKESMQKDIEDGIYEPLPFEPFVEQLKNHELECENLRFGSIDPDDDDYDWEDEDDLMCLLQIYDSNRYYNWVCEHDHDFIAERVGLDIDACHDPDDVEFTIELP